MKQSALNWEIYTDTPHGWPHLEIEHDGSIGWAEMQSIKNEVWGQDAVAIEMYPPAKNVINGNSTEFHFRHLFLLNDYEAWPNLRPDT